MKFNRTLALQNALYVLVLAVANRPVKADVITSAFQADHFLQFTKADFSDATWSSTLTFTIAPGSSGTRDFNLLFWPDNFGLTFSSTGAVTIDQTSLPPQTASATLHVTANGGGTFQLHETAGHGDLDSLNPEAVFISTITGRQDLLFQAPSSGDTLQLDTGTPWTTNIHIPGDWSQASTGNVQGTHVLLFLDPLWSITNNFVYDTANNQTLLSVFNPSYPGPDSEDNGPFPTVGLIGPVVPEPAEVMLTGIGIVFIGGLRLRLRRYHARTTAKNC